MTLKSVTHNKNTRVYTLAQYRNKCVMQLTLHTWVTFLAHLFHSQQSKLTSTKNIRKKQNVLMEICNSFVYETPARAYE